MSPTPTPDPDRLARIDALVARLRPAADEAIRRMAEQLVDRPDAELFGEVEYRLRDAAHDLAAAAHQTGLDARKKATVIRVKRKSAPGRRPLTATADRTG